MSLVLLESPPQCLAERIEAAVHTRTGGRIRGLQVRVIGGEIIISGRAPTYYAKQLATHAAMHSGEQVSVTNELKVG